MARNSPVVEVPAEFAPPTLLHVLLLRHSTKALPLVRILALLVSVSFQVLLRRAGPKAHGSTPLPPHHQQLHGSS